MKFRQMIFTLMMAVLALAVVACGATGADEPAGGSTDKQTLTFSPLALSIPALKGLSEGVKAVGGEKGYDVIVVDPDFDAPKQAPQLNELITTGRTNAAWVISVNPGAMKEVIDLAQEKQVVLVLNIRRIQQNLDITMIYVTHDQEEALVMSDQIAVFNHGRIVQVGTGEELYEEPNSRFVADFIGESNIFEGKLEKNGDYTFKTDQFRFTVPPPKKEMPLNRPLSLVVRPERLHVYPSNTKKQLVNKLNLRVKDVIYLGSERKYELETRDGTELIARHQVGDGFQPRAGDEVIASWAVERSVVVPHLD